MTPAVRRLTAAGLVAAGVALLAGLGIGLIAAGLGLAWSGVDIRVVAGVKQLILTAARWRGNLSRHVPPVDPPAPAATPYAA